ncbi:UDP-3-O-acyl-N-acetylglucosamine deacetylase [Bathymodiolus japonicus methanotrophic gill symbiont]|uniref:UDP-3-O-acyl-N-acetylglucosamine deacetylase n=1 Tax=Bathymodiolus japonicus methanotrophic gill symbiont TaxID=113269 RepID=UPI001E3EC823|nr:UDP-3-O-acyl-N-acetylglucosamine deacetylase [Bathymodiolus japonicus methanotrophic gill symbiont]
MTAAEVPIMDGSAGALCVFKFNLLVSGNHDAPSNILNIKREVKGRDGDKWADFFAMDGFKVNFFTIVSQPSGFA